MQVRYRVPEAHLAATVRGGTELRGSIHHPEKTEFTGLVTDQREGPDGRTVYDIVIFPPHRPEVHVDGVPEGDGPGTLAFGASDVADEAVKRVERERKEREKQH